MTERLVSKLHVALLSYDEREIRVRKNYLEEQNPAICCVCFHSGEELLRELRQQRSVDIVVLSSQLEEADTADRRILLLQIIFPDADLPLVVAQKRDMQL